MQARYLLFDFGYSKVKRRAPVSEYARAADRADPKTIRARGHRSWHRECGRGERAEAYQIGLSNVHPVNF